MDFKVRFPSQPVRPAGQPAAPAAPKKEDKGFAGVLQGALEKKQQVSFSAHALQRLESRRIMFGEGDLAKISEAVHAADKKGARSSLLLYNDVAMVASIKNKVIITALNGEEMRDHIFTNIDSAVIIR
jgi:flagellar operon protein